MIDDTRLRIPAARSTPLRHQYRLFRRLFSGRIVIGDVMSRVSVFGSRLGRVLRPVCPAEGGRRVAFISAVLIGAVSTFAASSEPTAPRSIDAFYEPFRVQQGALAPDGQHVAFVVG